jgi:hypothetical protein
LIKSIFIGGFFTGHAQLKSRHFSQVRYYRVESIKGSRGRDSKGPRVIGFIGFVEFLGCLVFAKGEKPTEGKMMIL